MELLDAHHLISLDIVARAIAVADVEWEEYPDIGESDFQIITRRVREFSKDIKPDADKVKEAYEFLSARSKEIAELDPLYVAAMTIMGHRCSELDDSLGGYLCACENASWSLSVVYPLRGACPVGFREAKKLVAAGWRPTKDVTG
jgi:hypothetical protein